MSDDTRIYLFDTTLRDGAQTQGVDFTVADKGAIAAALDKIGIDYIEGGWPGANPTDDRFFSERPPLQRARFTAFGMTRRPGRSVSNDPGMAALFDSKAEAICLVGKSWDFQVDVALGIAREENLELIGDSVAGIVARGREALFDCEHFFDGYKANPAYALACAEAAYRAGARWVVLCDTNGGTLPHEVERIVTDVAQRIPGERLGIHTHNDTENAVANTLAAVRAGVRQVQGTLNGLGERCGNANLVSIIPTLMLKMGYTTGVTEEGLAGLTKLSRWFDERLNVGPSRTAAYVGSSAFTHKGGLHVSAIAKDPRCYEHIDPVRVGNRRHIVVSDQAGRSNLLARFKEIGLELDPRAPEVEKLVDLVKQREAEGYAYDGAEASFEMLARRMLGQVPHYFELLRFTVQDERRYNARGELVTESEATVRVKVGGEVRHTVADGNGPVNAIDRALRKALEPFYPDLRDMKLVDFRVRILKATEASAAMPRVLIESANGNGERWSTVGVSYNIIDASFDALGDSFSYKLFREGVEAV
ncbi:MAG: citramalate synthase [Alphaproteobacteria bacterium]|jgi:2-isopropylmalate synthase|nr:citramalate synthase [Alphaproteobacteria bacterium]